MKLRFLRKIQLSKLKTFLFSLSRECQTQAYVAEGFFGVENPTRRLPPAHSYVIEMR